MYIEQTDSTNSLMQRLLRGEEPQYAACLEERVPLLYTTYQTAGRGQTGNGWESERGQNLLLSYLLREPQIKATEQFELNILAAVLTHLAVKDWLTDEQKPLLTIKWPNDIYYGDRKIAGILVENSLSGADVLHSIAGIGINVNQDHFPEELSEIATSIRLETGQRLQRADLLVRILESFEKYYGIYEKNGELSELKDRYNSLLVSRGKEVEVMDEKPYTGVSEGINAKGELLVRTKEGIKNVAYGEVSVRGIYGYV